MHRPIAAKLDELTAQAQPFSMPPENPAQRKRARRFWGGVGVMQRFDERRFTRTAVRLRGSGDLHQAVRVSARIFHGI